MKTVKKWLFLLLCITFGTVILPDTVIFDLGNVLIVPSRVSFIHSVGISKIVQYSLYNNPLQLESDFMAFLHKIKPVNTHYVSWQNNNQLLPQIFNDWLSGHASGAHTIACIERAAKKISCAATRDLFCALAHTMFDPEKFIQTLTINYEGIDFVRRCKADGHSVYILSNWDAESFALFAKKNKWFIELFDGIVISGEVGHVKPDPYIYQYLLTQYAIDPKNAFFVDDIIHNTRAAQDLDIFSVQCKQRSTLMGPFPHFAYIHDMFALWTDAQSHRVQ